MKCLFELPFKQYKCKQGYGVADSGKFKVILDTQERSDYVFKALSCHEKLVEELQEARQLIHDLTLEEAAIEGE